MLRRRDLRFRLANPGRYAWDLAASSLAGSLRGRSAVRRVRILLLSDGAESTSEEQYHPFDAFRAALKQDAGVLSAHLLVRDVLSMPARLLRSFDALALKLSFRTGQAEALRVVARAREIAGKRPIIYFDGDDDICIQYPQMLTLVNLYVKKHVFADPRDYLQAFVGKSNLTDYVHRRFGVSFADDPYATATRPVAADQIDKIVSGWNLALDSNILQLYARVRGQPEPPQRTVDVMFRGAVPNNWLRFLRQEIEPALQRLGSPYRVIVPTERISKEEYIQEMLRSRICLSPFGYGEICWRDFEAVLCGCLLVKPDMAHVRTTPDIFRPDLTYVPVRWDYSNLEERCRYYLARPEERARITRAAFGVLENYYRERGFFASLEEILRRVGLR